MYSPVVYSHKDPSLNPPHHPVSSTGQACGAGLPLANREGIILVRMAAPSLTTSAFTKACSYALGKGQGLITKMASAPSYTSTLFTTLSEAYG